MPNFKKSADGLLPAIIQDSYSARVLMLGYMNAEALSKTIDTGWVTFFSRSRQGLWTKGESSGNKLRFLHWSLDCDQDAILIRAAPQGPVCHLGTDTCWQEDNQGVSFLNQLEMVIDTNWREAKADSYVARLRESGTAKIAQKVGEEAVELVIEALGDNQERLLNEAADLLFHYLVLLQSKELRLHDVAMVLKQRHKQRNS